MITLILQEMWGVVLFKLPCQLISECGDKHENDYVVGTSVFK